MTPTQRMMQSLRGLAIGDAFGFKLSIRPYMIAAQSLPEGPWFWSDDTHMALSVVACLREHHTIEQDALHQLFIQRYDEDPRRGYGSGMKRLLGRFKDLHWTQSSKALFNGAGSYGNGAAMRVAPLGAYFADDRDQLIIEAKKQAEVTHAHPEAQWGAVAVALAAAEFATDGQRGVHLLQQVHTSLPDCEIKQGLLLAMGCPADNWAHAVDVLGNGALISAQDTVPFCLWCVAHHAQDAQALMWRIAACRGDEDTNCAIVGGILGAADAWWPDQWDDCTESTH